MFFFFLVCFLFFLFFFFFFFFFFFVFCFFFFFFFQAEDGIRDTSVTGVQTCALPISRSSRLAPRTYPSSRISRPTASPGHFPGPPVGSCSPNVAAPPRLARLSHRCPELRRSLSKRHTTRAIPRAISELKSRPNNSRTSTSPPAPPESPRAQCASTRVS